MICRTCGNKIQKDKRCSNTNSKQVSLYHMEVINLFAYDLSDDIKNIHPSAVCDNCRRKLDKCKSSKVKYSTQDKLPIFSTHSNEQCNICFLKTTKSKGFSVYFEKSLVPKLKLSETIFQIASKHNFLDLSSTVDKNLYDYSFGKFSYYSIRNINTPTLHLC